MRVRVVIGSNRGGPAEGWDDREDGGGGGLKRDVQ